MKTVFYFIPLIFSFQLLAQESDQSSTTHQDLCWSFCTNAFLESEAMRLGKPAVDLSEVYLIKKLFDAQAGTYLLMDGHIQLGPGGNLADGMMIYKKYGVIPQVSGEEELNKLKNIEELTTILSAMLDALTILPSINPSGQWKQAFDQTLDLYLGADQADNGASQYASENIGINPDEYLQLTSWTNFPVYEKTTLQWPDNWALHQSYNLPLEEFTIVIDSALAKGYTLLWAGDVTEPYFSWDDGLAYVPNKSMSELSIQEQEELFLYPLPEKKVTAQDRQHELETYQTRNDFSMQIVGKVDDQSARNWYLFKNACNIEEEEVFLYISRDYLQLKTISVLLHRDAIPESIFTKLK